MVLGRIPVCVVFDKYWAVWLVSEFVMEALLFIREAGRFLNLVPG